MSETTPHGEHVGHTPLGEPVEQLDGTAADQSGAAEDHVPSVPPSGTDAGLGDHATGDIVIDSALQDLQSASAEDLDTQIEAGRRVHQTLHARLSDLGGE